MESVKPILTPNRAAMVQHLELLFGRALTGKIELTAIKADAGPTDRPETRFFNLDQIEDAADWAVTTNTKHMWNVYVGAALRSPDVFPGKAADDDDFHAAYAICADVDEAHDLKRVRERYRALNIAPPFAVVTGRTPSTRAQLWWPLEDPIRDAETYRQALRAVAHNLGTDRATTAAKQLMRLGGGVAWPKAKKPGRILEPTEVNTPDGAQSVFTLEQIQRAFPPPEPATEARERAPEGGGSLAGAMAAPDLRSALASMRSDDRDLWVRMGHALKSLGDQGRGLWIEWSQTSDKYDPQDAARVWESLRGERTGFQAVFAEAQRQGWVNPATVHDGPTMSVISGPIETIDPETGEIIEAAPATSRPIQASSLKGDPPERQWIIDQWIVEGAVNSLYGDGGLGKTLLAQQLACSVSLGAPWLGMPSKPGPVLAILCEDEQDELHRRHNAIKAAMGHPMGNPFHDVWLWPRVGDENVLIRWDRDGTPKLGDFASDIVREVETINPALLILDTLADFYAGSEIDRPQVNYFVKTVLGGLIKRQKARGHALTVLLLGHPSVAGKATGSGYSGSTAWNAAVRSRMYLSRPEDGSSDERILTRGKANYASSGDETAIRLYFDNGALHANDDTTEGDAVLFAAREEACAKVDAAWRQGKPYSGQKTHPRYVYTALTADLKKDGYDPRIVRQALRELIIDDAIITLSKGRDKRGYRTSKSGD